MNDLSKQILTALREGASAEDLAKQMADALNAAGEVYKKEQTKASEADRLRTQLHDKFIDNINKSIDTNDIDLTDAAALATIAIVDAHKEVSAEQAGRIYHLVKHILVSQEELLLWATDDTKGMDEIPVKAPKEKCECEKKRPLQKAEKPQAKVVHVTDKDANAVISFLKDIGLV